MTDKPRVIMDESEFQQLKKQISDLYHAVCNVKVTEYISPEKTRVPFTEDEKLLISKLYNQGINVYKISQQLGRKYNSVKNYVKKNNN